MKNMLHHAKKNLFMNKNLTMLSDDAANLAMSYACMILADDDLQITADKLSNILIAANVAVESYWPGLYAKALCNIDKKTISAMFSGSVGASAPSGASGNIYCKPDIPFFYLNRIIN